MVATYQMKGIFISWIGLFKRKKKIDIKIKKTKTDFWFILEGQKWAPEIRFG